MPATADRWRDAVTLFEGDGSLGCWCQYRRRSSGAYASGGPGSGEAQLPRILMRHDLGEES